MEKDGKKIETRENDPVEVYRSWSKRLDRLGWTKVLVDVREDVPGVRVSVGSPDGSNSSENKNDEDDDGSKSGSSGSGSDNDNDSEKNEEEVDKKDGTDTDDMITHVNMKDTWTAGELLTEFKGGLMTAANTKKSRRSFRDLIPRIPLGHTVMIANAKDDFNRKVTTGGKPVMDYLGASLVRILQSGSIHTSIDHREIE